MPHASQDESDDRSARAKRLFAEVLRRLEADPESDFDFFLASHPELETELRELHGAWSLARTLGADAEPTFFRRAARARPSTGAGLEPGQRVGEFRLVSLIGQGGMGQVWEAQQTSLGDRRVAIKFVRPERVTPQTLEFFQREARAGGRLHHPNIVAVHGYGEDSGMAWIAMEHVDGAWTLRDFIDEMSRESEVPPAYDREVPRLVAEIAEAMQAAHDAGVVHRDLKPPNILITEDNHPKVTDFGLARITDETAISQTGEFAGTYFYMSPEQVAARRAGIDQRSDVFSLGVVLYELLTLRRPFEGDTTHQVAHKILFVEPADPRAIRSRVPRDLVVITGKALEKDPGRRYQTMTEFAMDLHRHLNGEPIHAKPASRWERAVKWAKRNPAKSVSGAAAVFAFAALAVLAIFLRRDLQSQRELAERGVELSRLSALQSLEDYIAEAGDAGRMWPVHPSRIDSYEDWIDRARGLVDTLPDHRARLAELRALARPRTKQERAREREAHPEFARFVALEEAIARHRRALDRRRGVAGEKPPSVEALDAVTLWEWAVTLCREGWDDEALEQAAGAVDAADDEQRAEFEARYEGMVNKVAATTSQEGLRKAERKIADLETEREALAPALDEQRDWRFPEGEEDARWWHGQLTKLIEGLEGLADGLSGLRAAEGISPDHGWSVPRRLAHARRLRDGMAEGSDWRARWNEAVALVRSHSAYGGLELPLQMGLVPIGPDPQSGLWEFWDVSTGEEPLRGEDRRLVLTEETGLVLVLIPGGRYWVGAQSNDRGARNYDPWAGKGESPVHEVILSPYLLSKYEITQGQWKRLTGQNPSLYGPNGLWNQRWLAKGNDSSLLHPVENVGWTECHRVLARIGLVLPSEAQWEVACRAGSDTPWWTGREVASLDGAANLADDYARRNAEDRDREYDTTLDDGAVSHTPVGSFAANGYGLHDVHGNVWEPCLDGYDPNAYVKSGRWERDPVASWRDTAQVVRRGGAIDFPAINARSAFRYFFPKSGAQVNLGVRPARVITPD